jgi:hypothetical protein
MKFELFFDNSGETVIYSFSKNRLYSFKFQLNELKEDYDAEQYYTSCSGVSGAGWVKGSDLLIFGTYRVSPERYPYINHCDLYGNNKTSRYKKIGEVRGYVAYDPDKNISDNRDIFPILVVKNEDICFVDSNNVVNGIKFIEGEREEGEPFHSEKKYSRKFYRYANENEKEIVEDSSTIFVKDFSTTRWRLKGNIFNFYIRNSEYRSLEVSLANIAGLTLNCGYNQSAILRECGIARFHDKFLFLNRNLSSVEMITDISPLRLFLTSEGDTFTFNNCEVTKKYNEKHRVFYYTLIKRYGPYVDYILEAADDKELSVDEDSPEENRRDILCKLNVVDAFTIDDEKYLDIILNK